MTKSLALDPHDLSSRGDLLPSRDGIPPRVASIIWNRNFPSLLSDPSTHGPSEKLSRKIFDVSEHGKSTVSDRSPPLLSSLLSAAGS